jgi:hypothetical protein
MIVIDSSNPFGSGEDRKVLFAARAVNYDKSQIGFRVWLSDGREAVRDTIESLLLDVRGIDAAKRLGGQSLRLFDNQTREALQRLAQVLLHSGSGLAFKAGEWSVLRHQQDNDGQQNRYQ